MKLKLKYLQFIPQRREKFPNFQIFLFQYLFAKKYHARKTSNLNKISHFFEFILIIKCKKFDNQRIYRDF